MDKLDATVVLAGCNGAGKSRLLSSIVTWKNRFVSEADLLARLNPPFLRVANTLTARSPNRIISKQRVERENTKPLLEYRRMISLSEDKKPVIIPFVPTRLALTDPHDMPPHEMLEAAMKVQQPGIGNMPAGTFARIQMLLNRKWEATHPDHTIGQNDAALAVAEFKRLEALIKKFLNSEVTRSANGEAELFHLPLGKSALSDGQKVILELCVAIHAQGASLNDLIIFMDEPENHLHPAALLDLVQTVQEHLGNGQLWIATHSVSLLAHFDPDSIWWMDKGTIRHAGSNPETVLSGLVGDDARIGKLSDFLGLPAALAASNFAHQCLLPASVVSTGVDDPQSRQIQRLIETHRCGERLRILDFGAGRGRLVSALLDGGHHPKEVAARIDYRAFEITATHRKECEAAITRLYGMANERYFHQEKDLRGTVGCGSVDVVVMCNVLHEIDPAEWLQLFSKEGLIRHLLQSDGFLLLVEDTEMRVGEKAHQRGFLVLDTADLRTLFRIPEKDSRFVTDDARKDGRLKAHLLPSCYLGNATTNTLCNTLRQVKHLAMEAIKKLRQETPSYRQGRKLAFYVQQLANAELSLAMFGGSSNLMETSSRL